MLKDSCGRPDDNDELVGKYNLKLVYAIASKILQEEADKANIPVRHHSSDTVTASTGCGPFCKAVYVELFDTYLAVTSDISGELFVWPEDCSSEIINKIRRRIRLLVNETKIGKRRDFIKLESHGMVIKSSKYEWDDGRTFILRGKRHYDRLKRRWSPDKDC